MTTFVCLPHVFCFQRTCLCITADLIEFHAALLVPSGSAFIDRQNDAWEKLNGISLFLHVYPVLRPTSNPKGISSESAFNSDFVRLFFSWEGSQINFVTLDAPDFPFLSRFICKLKTPADRAQGDLWACLLVAQSEFFPLDSARPNFFGSSLCSRELLPSNRSHHPTNVSAPN